MACFGLVAGADGTSERDRFKRTRHPHLARTHFPYLVIRSAVEIIMNWLARACA
jgi:hypothetical protein